jgi:Tol biopolymer transport system component
MLFLERPDELITRELITERIWTETSTIDVQTGINTAINRLRTNLGDDPTKPEFIETVIGLGYRFIGKIEEIAVEEEAPTESEMPLPAGSPAESTTSESGVWELVAPSPQEVSLLPLTAPEVKPLKGLSRYWVVLGALVGLTAATLLSLRLYAPHSAQTASTRPTLLLMTPVTTDHGENKVTAEAVSPNGQMIAYADDFGVSVHNFESGTAFALAPMPAFTVHRIEWSPSRKELLVSGTDVASHHNLVQLVPLRGAYTTQIVDDGDLASISPDGTAIAFTRAEGSEVWVASANGQNARRLLAPADRQTITFLLWSLDGKRILVERKEAPSAVAVTLPEDENAPQSARWLCDWVDANSGKLLDREENIQLNSAILLPDGRMTYLSQPASHALMLSVSLDDRTGHFLAPPVAEHTFEGKQARGLSSSLDGQRIAAILERGRPNIFVASLDHSQPGRVLALKDIKQVTYDIYEAYPHFWASDDSILYETPPSPRSKFAIYAKHLNENAPRLIASGSQEAAMAEQSPDGRWILFLAGAPHQYGIYRIPFAGGKVEQVPTTGTIEEFHCPQISTASCVLREAIGNQYLVYSALDPVTGIGKELTRTPWEPNRLGDWGLSPDGRTVISAVHDTLQPSLHRVELDGSSAGVKTIPFQGPGSPLGIHWARDGRALFVESRTESGYNLEYVDFEGHSTVLQASRALIWAVPSPDGTKIAFPAHTEDSNVWSTEMTPSQDERPFWRRWSK